MCVCVYVCVCVCMCVCDLCKCILVAVDELCKALIAPKRQGAVQILIIIMAIRFNSVCVRNTCLAFC